MTRQSTFKSKIRARMRKTGERYAAARLALLSQREPTSAPIPIPPLPGYQFAPGVEPDLGLLTAALAQAGVIDPMTGAPFTEARLFGLSGGIGFMYFLFEYQGHPPMMTFTCRSWSMPEPVITRALTHAGIEAARSETSSAKVASAFVDDALAEGRVIHLTADAASLPSAGVPELWIGQLPRQLNVVGVQGDDVLVDFNAPIVLSRALLARARAACRKEKHRAWTFPKGQAKAAPVAATRAAVRATARSFVEAPYKGFAGNFGLAGLEKAARLCADPKDKKGWARVFHSGPLAYRALYRTWECATLELTPPAGGRSFYAQFLRDAAARCDLPALAEAAALAEQSGERFAALAEDAIELGGSPVAEAITIAHEIEELQRSGDPEAGPKVRALRDRRDKLAEQCTLDQPARRAAFTRIGEHFAAIHALELELQRRLAEA